VKYARSKILNYPGLASQRGFNRKRIEINLLFQAYCLKSLKFLIIELGQYFYRVATYLTVFHIGLIGNGSIQEH